MSKQFTENGELAFATKKKVFSVCKSGAFFGCCHAGVGEFVYPIKDGDHIIGFISVSGFLTDVTVEKLLHFAKKHNITAAELSKLAHRYLSPNIPPKQTVDAVIEPLILLLEAYFEQKREQCTEEMALYYRVLRYVTENCHTRLTMSELATHFHYSVSTLSHLFLKNSGKSLPAYIEDLRLNEAKWYLANSDTSITEIAMFLGYSSSNYFSSMFKKRCDMTPKEYRNRS